ncbi:MAG: hypothetical protein ACHQNT_01520 [Bacteroidia bacterium]|jgi:hypothetical protein
MADDKIFPPKLAEFNQYLGIAVPWLNSEKVRLGVSAGNILDLTTLYSDPVTGWTIIYPKTTDDTTATKALRDQRDLLRVNIEKKMRLIFGDIPQSVLTTEDRTKLRLKAPDTVPTRADVMDHSPDIDIEKTIHLQHTLRFRDPANPDSDAMPDKQKVVLEVAVAAAGVPDAQLQWGNSRNITRFLTNVPFTDTDVGRTAYYRCCYENTRGERSVWSATVSAVIG